MLVRTILQQQNNQREDEEETASTSSSERDVHLYKKELDILLMLAQNNSRITDALLRIIKNY